MSWKILDIHFSKPVRPPEGGVPRAAFSTKSSYVIHRVEDVVRIQFGSKIRNYPWHMVESYTEAAESQEEPDA